jgi:hypothetical protein
LAVLQHGQSSKYLSVVRIAKYAEWRWLDRVEVWPNMHPSVSLTAQTFALLKMATYVAMKIPT